MTTSSYRYSLRRHISSQGSCVVTFVMLNPSTADDDTDDPTIRRCMGFARRFNAAAMHVVNLWPIRATNPKELKTLPFPDGGAALNLQAIRRAIADSDLVVAAWGANVDKSPGSAIGGPATIAAICELENVQAYHLGPLTKAGHPRHPLYLPADAPLSRWAHGDG